MHVIDAFERAQHLGVATWPDLAAHGVSSRALTTAVADRVLVRVHRGTYARGLPRGAAAARAATLSLRGVAGHETAALLHGMTVPFPPAATRVTVPRDRSGARRSGVHVSRADIPKAEVTWCDGIPLTSPLRTVLDCARHLPQDEALAVTDSALRMGLVTRTELRRTAHGCRGPGCRSVRDVAALADGRAESALESLVRALLLAGGLTTDALQHEIYDLDGRFVARVDLWFGPERLAVEVDGFAYHSDRSSYRRDRHRGNALHLAGVGVLRFSWEDVVTHPEYVLRTVRAALHR